MCSGEHWNITEDFITIYLLCTASAFAAFSVWILKNLSSYTNIMNITRFLSMRKKILIHSSLIDELIENRKNLFSTYIRDEVRAGRLDLTTDITDDWVKRTLGRGMMEQMGTERSKTEGIIFDGRGVDEKDVIFPAVDGNYFIIRYCLIRNSRIK